MANFTEDQNQKEEIFYSILNRVNRPSFWALKNKGQVNYHFNNEIASYSLYNDSYLVSKEALELVYQIFDVSKSISRKKIYSYKLNNKKTFIFEHLIPASIQREEIKKIFDKNGKVEESELRSLLDKFSVVCILTQGENKKLEKKLRSKFPTGKDPINLPFARYDECGIELSNTNISVKGAICR